MRAVKPMELNRKGRPSRRAPFQSLPASVPCC